MFENVDRVHGHFLQYSIFKVVVGRFYQLDMMRTRNSYASESIRKLIMIITAKI